MIHPTLEINGELLEDDESLERYSTDLSGYHLKPRMVAVPKDQESVVRIVDFAKLSSMPITPRGAVSNLSGPALGRGMIISTSSLNKVGSWREA